MTRDLTLPDAAPLLHRLLWPAVIAAVLYLAVFPAAADTDDGAASWSPTASERLMKLPGNYLKRAVEHDFARSEMAAALQDTERLVNLKTQTLEDLRGAVERADGDLKAELEHQFLAEKRDYLELMVRHQDLRRRHVETKIRVYEKMLRKMGNNGTAMTPQHVALMKMQDDAQKRFQASVNQVDLKLFRATAATESRYAREYAKNMAAIETLVQAVNAHPMNAQARVNGQPVDKQDYLRQLIAENEARLATIGQEGTVLAYMAKLVSLDALALSETVAGGDPDDANDAEPMSVTSAVDFFVTR
jgi:hypothetical protein